MKNIFHTAFGGLSLLSRLMWLKVCLCKCATWVLVGTACNTCVETLKRQECQGSLLVARSVKSGPLDDDLIALEMALQAGNKIEGIGRCSEIRCFCEGPERPNDWRCREFNDANLREVGLGYILWEVLSNHHQL